MWANKIECLRTQSGIDYPLTAKGAHKGPERSYKKDNKTCCGLLFHYMSDSMYRINVKMQGAMKIEEALRSDSDDIRIKKYAYSRVVI